MNNKVPIKLKELSTKASSKRELYFILLNDWKVYMPLIQDANVDYVRCILTGKIKVFIRLDDLLTLVVC